MESILITGANRGIGLALTQRFLEGGYKVFAACRNPDHAKALNALNDADSMTVCQLDVTEQASVSRLSALLGDQQIDILVNNAGVMGGARQSMTDMDYGAWIHAFEVNTLAPFRIATELRKNLKGAIRPRIVTLSSQMGSLNRKSTGALAYRSSKAAVNKVMQVLALELKQDGIIACPVHPGWVQTEMGGGAADISAQESADGLFNLIEGLTEDHSGRFWTWDGQEHPW